MCMCVYLSRYWCVRVYRHVCMADSRPVVRMSVCMYTVRNKGSLNYNKRFIG